MIMWTIVMMIVKILCARGTSVREFIRRYGQSRFIRVTRSGVNPEPRTVVDLARGGAVMSRPMEECEVAILNGGDNPLPPPLPKEAPRSLLTHIHGASPLSSHTAVTCRSFSSVRSLAQHTHTHIPAYAHAHLH